MRDERKKGGNGGRRDGEWRGREGWEENGRRREGFEGVRRGVVDWEREEGGKEIVLLLIVLLLLLLLLLFFFAE